MKTIYDKLMEIPFVSDGDEARKPDEDFVVKQRPRIMFYTADILKFITAVINKVAKPDQVHLIRLLFCRSDVGFFNKYQNYD